MFSRWFARLLLCAPLALPVSAALSGEIEAMGDGSETNNADLLRGAYEGACDYGCEVDDLPHEERLPPFKLDWSLALRGSYVRENATEGFEASVVPTVSFRHQGLRSSFGIAGQLEIVKPDSGPGRIASALGSFASSYAADEWTTFNYKGSIAQTQGSATASGNPATTAVAPISWTGDIEGAVTRDLGFLDATLRLDASRSVYGETTLADASIIDNSSNNNSVYGAGIRLGHKLTPIVTAFVDASALYNDYDNPSPTLLVQLDGPEYALKGGFSAEWGNVLAGEASVGVGLRRFDAGLSDVTATLYSATAVFRPDETLTFTGSFDTSIGAPGPNGSGSARIEYVASSDVSYIVNPWLTLRGSASWRQATFAGSANTETGYSVGAGADYLLSEQMTVNADYQYSHAEATGSVAVDTHKVTAGVTFSD